MSTAYPPPNETHFVQLRTPLTLESGAVLRDVTIAWCSWGKLNHERDNAVLVCHALTGSADVAAWWPGMLGSDCALDPERDFILCSNVLSGCYGTTGPSDINPDTGRRYGNAFPAITIRDMVKTQARMLDELGVSKLALVIGGSLGGMQVLEWAALYPQRVRAIVPIAVSGRQSAWAIGFSEAQRCAIYADADWKDGCYRPDQPPTTGLAAARMIAMLSYRHWRGFEARFRRKRRDNGRFEVESWLRHHGEKLVRRFDAASYVRLTQAMDSHDLGHVRGGYHATLAAITTPALVVGISSDMLYPLAEQQELAACLPNARLTVMDSVHGHDAFLMETGDLNRRIQAFRDSLPEPAREKYEELLPCKL